MNQKTRITVLGTLILLALGVLLFQLYLPKNPWLSVSNQIKQQVKGQLMASEAFSQIPENKINAFLDCTNPGQMKFLESSACDPHAEDLIECLESKGLTPFLLTNNEACLNFLF